MIKEQEIIDIVDTFFREYTREITLAGTGKTPEQLQPKIIKQVMLEHYEEIAEAFHRAAYPKIAEINGLPHDIIPEEITPETMRTVCVTETLFNAMADAYRQNFIALLQGRTM